jgi:hypothetical protein
MNTRPVKEITTIAAMTAIMEAAKIALSFLQNIELVSLLIILYTLHFGLKRTMASIYIFDGIETLIWGIGIWVISYLYVWPILSLLTYLLRRYTSKGPFVLLSTLFGLSFGALCALTTVVIGGPKMALSWWITGIPYDLVHGAGNFTVAFLLFTPLTKAIVKVKEVFHLAA